MAVSQIAEESIRKFTVQLDDLDKIVQAASQCNDHDSAFGRLKLWESRTFKLISRFISPHEARKFEHIEPASITYHLDPFLRLEQKAKAYRGFLVPLIEEIREHPNDVIADGEAKKLSPARNEKIGSETENGFVFIAMPMNPDDHQLVDVHDTIRRAAKELTLYAERVDDEQTNERISLRIIDSLRKAQFVVADLTHSKPNVYYEAGFAQALGKTPIYIAREGTEVEFDVHDYPVIFFRNNVELQQKLNVRLNALKEGDK